MQRAEENPTSDDPASSRRAMIPHPVGIIAALELEAAGLIEEIGRDAALQRHDVAGRVVHAGRLWDHPCLLTLAGVGKVAAAITATMLIERFGVRSIVFTGVAGGVGDGVGIGDVVVASHLVQHDLDASPIFPRFQVPLLGLSHLPTDEALTALLLAAARTNADGNAVHHGLIGSGDQFIHRPDHAAMLVRDLPGLLAVEMEGAAVAQVCLAFGVPCAVMRTISDRADSSAPVDFPKFLAETASRHSHDIVRRLLGG